MTECFAAGENEIDRHNYSARPLSSRTAKKSLNYCNMNFMMEVIHNFISVFKMNYKTASTQAHFFHELNNKQGKTLCGKQRELRAGLLWSVYNMNFCKRSDLNESRVFALFFNHQGKRIPCVYI